MTTIPQRVKWYNVDGFLDDDTVYDEELEPDEPGDEDYWPFFYDDEYPVDKSKLKGHYYD